MLIVTDWQSVEYNIRSVHSISDNTRGSGEIKTIPSPGVMLSAAKYLDLKVKKWKKVNYGHA
jgi:hypothetical protein